MIQVCLNGPRAAAGSGAVPMSPAELADAARRAVAAGARDVHVHPKSPCGRDSLSARALTPVLEAIRAVVDVPVGVTTGAWAEPDPDRRVARIRSWDVLPDHASVNWHEPGAEAVAEALLERGVGVEAGIWSGTDGPARFAASPLGPRVLRVLAEVTDSDAGSAARTARGLLDALAAYGAHGRPVLLHGEDGGAWPVLRLAGELGLDTRIGIEDTLFLPDGVPAASNAALVSAAFAATGLLPGSG
ncbi:3-keto-5-aminohexanoate cleavage protein [Streptomyces sp. MST-110588]|uniref:3-keto-5-aminohexanoate cleavage protein n=1 Tax=Streptomyces sp. MST-110588 TaxID=2833628 RepID=UPI001F5D66B6|nr:3-keto-5-aminohexanoate cleavage protein [Streptomyces sp. MST-110588]UNO42935.1 3-keto-5-aminohexanoate cleavage protein [Streptomyces sp. MST-110588]